MKTIKELAELIGVSKVSLYKAIKRPELQSYISKDENNVTIIDKDGVNLLTSLFNCEKAETIDEIAATVLTSSKPVNSLELDLISILQGELKQKNDEIKSLLNIINNQQQISLQTNCLLTARNTEQPKPKKRFWNILFRLII